LAEGAPAPADQAKSGKGFLGKAFFGGFFGCFGVIAAGVVLLIIVAVVVAVSQDDKADVVSGDERPVSQATSGGEPAKPDALNLEVGNTAKVGDAEVTLNSYRLSRGDGTFGPDAGNIYVIVDVTVRNTGDDPYNLSSLLQTALRDPEGREHNLTIAIGADTQGQLDGTIPPGDILRGEEAFEVPEGSTGLQFVFSQALGDQQARWNLR
jgi:hypothetical protein